MVSDPTSPATCQHGCEMLLNLGNRRSASFTRTGSEIAALDATRLHIWAQTPRSVWDAYSEDGICIQDAIRTEMSYL